MTTSRPRARLAPASRRRAALRRAVGHVETLPPRTMLAADPVISEFMASNSSTLQDGFAAYSDWIEVTNQGDASVNLAGWYLTDDAGGDLEKWTFPARTLAPGASLVVFASNRDTVDPAGHLHTNFALSAGGEALALVRPDGTIASAYNANAEPYPPQIGDVSYGFGNVADPTVVTPGSAPVRTFVPTNGSTDSNAWTQIGYDDAGWTTGTGGVGFDTDAYEDDAALPALLARWDADDLQLANNAAVTSWASNVGNGAAATATGQPRLLTNGLNGRKVVRFAPSDGSDVLRVPAAGNPASGAGDFSVAVVFRTSTVGAGGNANYTGNTALVDAELGGGLNDWGVGLASTGQIGAGTGTPTRTVYGGSNLSNGAGHVAIFSRQGGVLTLYVDGGDGVSRADGSTAARAVGDLAFGGGQEGGRFFAGDLAHVAFYGGALDAQRAYDVAGALGAEYGVTIAPPTPVGVAGPIATWTADSLNSLANNAPVASWLAGGRNAAQGDANFQPTLVKGQLNGRSVVRFDGVNDRLRLNATANPLSNAGDFTAAFVFRALGPAVGGIDQWYNNTGIVDSEQGGTTADWGVALNAQGRLAAGFGNPDVTLYGDAGHADNGAHSVVVVRKGDSYSLSVDGGAAKSLQVSTAARNFADLVFGGMQTNLNFFHGDLADVRLWQTALDDDAARAVAADLSATYGTPLLPGLYDALIGTDVQGAAHTVAPQVLVRVPVGPFDASGYGRLALDVNYDDGFVAYLNGVEVARRNAPTSGTVTYTSAAAMRRADSAALVAERIDITQFKNLLNATGPNVLAFRALNASAGDPDLLLHATLSVATLTPGVAYFDVPTPGAPNADGYFGVLADPSFSAGRGYYSAPTSTTVSAVRPGATLVYTLDGSEPTLTNGTVVQPASSTSVASQTLNITTTTKVRAVAFRKSFLPSFAATHTFVFPSATLAQGESAPAGAYWDTAVNQSVVNSPQAHAWADALRDVPTVSLNMDYDGLFGGDGIYANPLARGRAWEREASFEYFDPQNPSDQVQLTAGVRIQGAVGRFTSRPKKSFRVYFRSEYGASRLEYPIFGANHVAQTFDHLVLRGGHNYTWANDSPALADYLRDEWARQNFERMGDDAATGRFVHLYLNGLYWGMYDMTEEPDENWAAEHFGGAEEDYEVLEPDNAGGIEAEAGSTDAYLNLFNTLDQYRQAGSDGGASLSAAEYAWVAARVDVENLVDYTLQGIWRGDRDSPTVIGGVGQPRNFVVTRDAAHNGKFRFEQWDGEIAMDDVNFDETEQGGFLNPGLIYQSLRTNLEFRQYVADRVYLHWYNDGAFDVVGANEPRELYNELVAEIDKAVQGESARWGDWLRPGDPYQRDPEWLANVNWMRNVYMPQRSGVTFNQLRADFNQLTRLPPGFVVNGQPTRGGSFAPGSTLALQVPSGQTGSVYYTLDGSDPRLPGGAIAPTAILYTGPVTLSASANLTVRVLDGAIWSPIDRAQLTVGGPANASNLTVSEIQYHPHDVTAAELAALPGVEEDEFEFVEFWNRGAAAVSLAGVTVGSGITLNLTGGSIPAGGRAVIVKNEAAFRLRYGQAPVILGVYGGSLSNSSETVTFTAADGTLIASVTWQDVEPWTPRADGDGSSLELVAPNTDPNDPLSWRASAEFGGSPGVAGNPAQTVVINEVVAAAANGVDAIELFNPTSAAVNVGGWSLTDSQNVKFVIPAGTVLAAGAYRVFTSVDFDVGAAAFGLGGAAGDRVFLIRTDASGNRVAFADGFNFGSSAVGESWGRVAGSGRTDVLYPIATPTLGTVNSAPRLGPVTITEIGYRATAALQYVELQNQTDAAVSLAGWRFDLGLNYTFAAGTTLAAHEPIVLVGFNPNDVTQLAAFRAAYGIDANVRVVGPFTGGLSASGERLRLIRPDAPRPDDPTVTPQLYVDGLTYRTNGGAWPTVAAGQALVRASSKQFADSAANWVAEVPSVGTVRNVHAWFAGPVAHSFGGAATLDSLTLRGTAAVSLGGTDGTLRTGALDVGPAASLDLGAGTLIVDYAAGAPSPFATVRGLVATGRNGGTWDGTGLRSTGTGAAAGTTLGYAEASGLTPILRAQLGADESAVVVRHTLLGDATLDRAVNFSDLSIVAANYNATGRTYAQGNVEDDLAGNVNFADLSALAARYGGTLPAPLIAQLTGKPAKTARVATGVLR